MKNLIVVLILPLILTGCWLAIAGAGTEVGYVIAQGDRTAAETVSDQSITAKIKTKLLADAKVSGLDINVDTFKGTVTLKGVTDSLEESERAIAIARGTAGVNDVVSKLVVVN